LTAEGDKVCPFRWRAFLFKTKMNKPPKLATLRALALKRKYRETEGFLDDVKPIELELAEDVVKTIKRVARQIQRASGVSFQTAVDTIFEDLIARHAAELREKGILP
jgi:hypothetical protein